MMELVKRVLRHSAMRYLVVGGLSFAVNVLLLNILIVHLHWDPERVAAPAAFLLTFGVAYTLQRVFTFRSEAGVNGSMARYLVLAGVNTLAQIPLHELGSALGLGTARRQILATGIITVWNYFAYRHWVYVDRSHPLPADEETVAWHERAVHRVRVVANIGPSGAATSGASSASGQDQSGEPGPTPDPGRVA
ncbi:MAG: GtrA family protein [Austwickia sp.]|jgi:putative flippase GtrA|nr:MAG: GtrA family protein [Austwickia sp.]